MQEQDLVLVAGATGGVGQLVVAKLLAKNISVRALTRDSHKAQQMFDERVEIAVGDLRERETLIAATKDITHIICCAGTTAFPSLRWDFANLFQAKNTPEAVDAEGVKNLLAIAQGAVTKPIAPADLKRFVFISSCGVLRKDSFPFNILNLFGVLDAKLQGEIAIKGSGLTYTIIRPARLIDGPYTSYDLNTLLRAKTDGKQAVVIDTGDTLNGETSRIDVANACVECLDDESTANKTFEIINSGERPPRINWSRLFAQI